MHAYACLFLCFEHCADNRVHNPSMQLVLMHADLLMLRCTIRITYHVAGYKSKLDTSCLLVCLVLIVNNALNDPDTTSAISGIYINKHAFTLKH